MQTTRREALVAITGTAAVSTACGSKSADPTAGLNPETVDRLAVLVDVVIPPTETPGAHDAGVTRMVEEDAAESVELTAEVSRIVDRFASDGFFDMEAAGRESLMSGYMNAGDERAEIFTALKNMTIDRYYSTEVGLVEELGYQGNTYLAEYPGCAHNHELDDRGSQGV